MSTDLKQVLILGGGFAGVYTARYLEKMLRASGRAAMRILSVMHDRELVRDNVKRLKRL